jgi:hypothetical protein
MGIGVSCGDPKHLIYSGLSAQHQDDPASTPEDRAVEK